MAQSPGAAGASEMQQLEGTMAQFLQPNNAVRKAAEGRLKVFLRKPTAAGLLLQVTTSSAFPEARQMAALFLRKKINTYWIRLSDEHKTVTKRTIIERLAAEPERSIRRALAGLAAALSKHLLPSGDWPELPAFIGTCSEPSSPPRLRELAMLLLRDVIEVVGHHLAPTFDALRGMMARALADSEPKVRYAALRAVALMMTMLSGSDEVMHFQALVPTIFTVIQQAVATADDDVVISALDAVAEIAEGSSPMLTPYTNQLFTFMLQLLMNREVDLPVTDCAGQVVINLITTRPKAMIKAGVVPQVMSTALQMAMSYDEEEHKELHASGTGAFHIGSSGAMSAAGVAERILDKLAIAIPSKHMLPMLMKSVVPALSHTEWKVRRAALVALAMVAEGCVDPEGRLGHVAASAAATFEGGYNATLHSFVAWAAFSLSVMATCQDAHPICRSAACWCLGQWSQHLKPHILTHHDEILPAVFAALHDGDDEVQNTGCFVLESFCENLEPENVCKYLDNLMAHLGRLITSPNVNVREMAVSAIGSVVIGSRHHFAKFFEATMNVMIAFMQLGEDETMSLRARATDCVGYIAVAVGREMFDPKLAEVIHHAMQGLALKHPEVTEYTFMFFSNMAKLLKTDFEPFLETLVPVLMDVVRSNDGVAYSPDDTDRMGDLVNGFDDDDEAGAAELGGEDDDSDDYDAPEVGQVIRVRTAMLDLKSAAALTLGQLAEHTGVKFGEHIADVTNLLLDRTSYFHEELRQNCWSSIGHMVNAALAALPAKPPTHECPMYTLHPDVEHMIDQIMSRMLLQMQVDDDREVVARCCENVIQWCKAVGAAAVYKHLTELGKVVVALLKERTVCQRYEPDEEEDDAAAEHDFILIDVVSDVIAALAKGLGPSCEPHIRPMLKPLLKYCRPSRPVMDRAMAVGLFAEIAEGIGAAIAPHVPALWPAIYAAMRDPSPKLQRNGAFACGYVLSRAGGTAAGPAINDALNTLHTLATATGVEAVVHDNALGAIARLVSTYHGTLPLNKWLSVLVSGLPTQEDHEEDRPIFLAFVALLAARKPEAVALINQLTYHFGMALAPDATVPEDVQRHIVTCLRGLAGQHSAAMGAVFVTLPAPAQAAITAALSGAPTAAPGSPASVASPSPPRA